MLEAGLTVVWGMSVMAGDSCGTRGPNGPPEPRICDGEYFATWWLGYAAVLVAAAIVTPILILLAPRFRWWRWTMPFAVSVMLLVVTVGYFVMITR